MRPVYETKQNILNEDCVADKLAAAWDVTLEKLPRFFPADRAAIKNGEIVGFVEIKCRKEGVFENYKTILHALEKHMRLQALQLAAQVPVLFVAASGDDVRWIEIDFKNPGKLTFEGRRDRGDSDDVQPFLHLDVSKFNKLNRGII